MAYSYHVTVYVYRPGSRPTHVALNLVDLPEPLDTFNGVALAIGRASQILCVNPEDVAIVYHIEIKTGPGKLRSTDPLAALG